jgi:hypothetical protein
MIGVSLRIVHEPGQPGPCVELEDARLNNYNCRPSLRLIGATCDRRDLGPFLNVLFYKGHRFA